MKIGPLESKPSTAPVAGDRKTAAGKAATTGNAEASAKVELSSAAMLQPGAADGTFDAQKVERIAQAIRDGNYQINADAIADKLIANAQELLARTYR